MQKPIYHGKTIVHEIDTQHPVDVKIANEGMVIFNTPNIFPEYFFISVPMFDDVINAEIDEWLYVMKHSDTKKDFKSPYMTKVAERLAVIKMNTAERNEYIHYQKQSVHSQDVLHAATAKGKAEEKIEIAKNMLSKSYSISDISSITCLSTDEIKKLHK